VIRLYARSSPSRNYKILILTVSTTGLWLVTVLYMTNATIQNGPFLPLPYQSSSSAIITSGFLFLFLATLLQQFKSTLYDRLRWSDAASRERDGIPVLEFLVLEPSAPLAELVRLLFWDISKQNVTSQFPVSVLQNILQHISSPSGTQISIIPRLRGFCRLPRYRWIKDVFTLLRKIPRQLKRFWMKIRGPWFKRYKSLVLWRYVLPIFYLAEISKFEPFRAYVWADNCPPCWHFQY
jgi:hypothetical protein